MICQECKTDHSTKGNVRWCDRSDIEIERDDLKSKLAKAREALFEIMVVHTYYEPASMIARAALKEIE